MDVSSGGLRSWRQPFLSKASLLIDEGINRQVPVPVQPQGNNMLPVSGVSPGPTQRTLVASWGQRINAFLCSAQHQAEQGSTGLEHLPGTVIGSEHNSSSRLHYFAKG